MGADGINITGTVLSQTLILKIGEEAKEKMKDFPKSTAHPFSV